MERKALKKRSRNYDEDYNDYEERGGYKSNRRFPNNKKRTFRKKKPFIVEVELVDPQADIDTSDPEKNSPHVPVYQTPASAGCDLVAYCKEDIIIPPLSRATIETNVKFKIPYGFYGEIASRSGIARSNGIMVMTGTIDADYRGPVKVVLFNSDKDEEFVIHNLDRIAQIIFKPVKHARMINVEKLSEDRNNQRGEGGFGSTGTSAGEDESDE